jgi:hypothetical protein
VAVVVVVGVVVVFAADLPLVDGDDRVVLGTITVTVTLGVVLVVLVPDFVVVWPDPAVGFLCLPAPGWNDANSTVPPGLGVKLVLLADPEEADPEPEPPDPPDPPEPQLAVV